MKIPSLSKKDARALRLGAMLIIPVAVYMGVLAPAVRTIARDRETLAKEQRALESDSALIVRSRTIATDQARTTAWLGHEARRLFTGGTEIAATSALSDYISAAAANAGLQLQQSETRPAVTVSGALRAVHVDVRGQGTARALLTFIQSLENGNRLVRVDQFLVGPGSTAGTSPIGPQGRPSSSGATAQSQPANAPAPDAKTRPLSIIVGIYGYAILPPPTGIRVLTADLGAPYEPLQGTGISPITLADAVTHNPFSRDRDVTEHTVTVATTARGAPPFPIRLLGTVVGNRGETFAMCSITGATPTAVRTGDQVAGYTVRGIERGSMSLTDANGRLVHLNLPTPGA